MKSITRCRHCHLRLGSGQSERVPTGERQGAGKQEEEGGSAARSRGAAGGGGEGEDSEKAVLPIARIFTLQWSGSGGRGGAIWRNGRLLATVGHSLNETKQLQEDSNPRDQQNINININPKAKRTQRPSGNIQQHTGREAAGGTGAIWPRRAATCLCGLQGTQQNL